MLLYFCLTFLSHLCGEEVMGTLFMLGGAFLSHLCGEEVVTTGMTATVTFLSHLCGEEETQKKASTYF